MNCSFLFLVFVATVSVSLAFDCTDRHCSITKNDKNETVFDCVGSGSSNDTNVVCYYFASRNKIILSTKDSKYVPIDKIVTGAFSRLFSDLIVDKIYINRLQFRSLNQTDFDGLINISEIRIENPNSLASDTFLSIATTTKYFILIVSCVEGNTKNSFDSLYLMSNKWRLYTQNCYKELTCQSSSCEPKVQSPMFKIISSDIPVNTEFQITDSKCIPSPLCITNEATTSAPSQAKMHTSTVASTILPTNVAKVPVIQEIQSNDHYDSLMYIVLILTSVNSIVILGILVFLIVWWNKLSTSSTKNKHTIVLDDEDDSKYLNCTPYA